MQDPNEQSETQFRLTVQANIPLKVAENGESIYKTLKNFVQNVNKESVINGQIMKMMEPCCGKKGKK